MILQKLFSSTILRSQILSHTKRVTRKSSLSVFKMAPIFNYPEARRDEIKETYFGSEVKFVPLLSAYRKFALLPSLSDCVISCKQLCSL